MNIRISTRRLNLVSIGLSHISPTYLDWLSPFHHYSRYIMGCRHGYTLAELAKYVEAYIDRDDVVFLAIETKSGVHIGNIKYDPISIADRIAEMGILIGDYEWMGKGVAGEVIQSSSLWLKENMSIEHITLGLATDNKNAMSAYKKIGFVETLSTGSNTRMRLDI